MGKPLKKCFPPSLLAFGFRLKSCHMLDDRLALLRKWSLRRETMRTQQVIRRRRSAGGLERTSSQPFIVAKFAEPEAILIRAWNSLRQLNSVHENP